MHTVRRALQSIYDATDTGSMIYPGCVCSSREWIKSTMRLRSTARKKLLENDLRELVVLSGPFKGLRYPHLRA